MKLLHVSARGLLAEPQIGCGVLQGHGSGGVEQLLLHDGVEQHDRVRGQSQLLAQFVAQTGGLAQLVDLDPQLVDEG